jgi:hypothetical protein
VFYKNSHICRVIGKPETWIYNFDATHVDDNMKETKRGPGFICIKETREDHVSKHRDGYKEENNMKTNVFTPKVC